jgi:meckelin
VRYASKIILQMQTQSENPSKLYPPILTIQYATATSDSWSGNEEGASLSLMFHVEYSMKTDNFWASMKIIIGFLFALGVLIFSIRIANWQSRQRFDNGSSGSAIGLRFLLHAFMIACHTLSLLFFLFLFLICAYWFVFFKLQHEVFLLLPPENELILFEATFHALFWCQTIYVTYTVVQQCQSDIIFVDWEQNHRKKLGNGISMWRLLLVADIWNKMQARRRSNMTFSLVFIGFVMTGLGQNQNAIPRPSFQDNGNTENISNNTSNVLGFANTVIFWCAAAVIQWVWRFVFYERFLHEPAATKFVDLCTVCNISVFIMMENHKGYYLHCKSPYQRAECSMEELLKSLDREGRGLLTARSLDGAPGDCQTFDFYASPVFRRQISKMYSYARPRQDRFHFRSNSNNAEKANLARDELTFFLQNFIERQPPPSRDGLRYVVRESWLAERLLGITPNDFRTKSEPTCIMHPDNYGFLSSTFLGIGVEIDLLIHDILTYNVASMTFNNVGISLMLTYSVHLARKFLRSWFGQKNLSEKALVDERFLG